MVSFIVKWIKCSLTYLQRSYLLPKYQHVSLWIQEVTEASIRFLATDCLYTAFTATFQVSPIPLLRYLLNKFICARTSEPSSFHFFLLIFTGFLPLLPPLLPKEFSQTASFSSLSMSSWLSLSPTLPSSQSFSSIQATSPFHYICSCSCPQP